MPKLTSFQSPVSNADYGGLYIPACAPAIVLKNIDATRVIFIQTHDVWTTEHEPTFDDNAMHLGPGETLTIPIDSIQHLWFWADWPEDQETGPQLVGLYYSAEVVY